MRKTILFGGKAGQGPNILSELVAKGLISKGYCVFYSRDYQSLIRGGHNFNVLTFSDKPIASNDKQLDIVVALDEDTLVLHKKNIDKNCMILKGNSENMLYAGELFKILDIDFSVLDSLLKELERKYKENIEQAKQGYNKEKRNIGLETLSKKKYGLINGNQAIAEGAIKSGIEYYYAYPMTPATGVLTELAQAQLDKNTVHTTIELENEISVINAAIGSSIVGAKSMVGTSGGGFDLMTEALSLTGIAEIPLVLYLSQRPGPATGVATYTGQGDLKMALGCGHGEFSRVVLAPGSAKESVELTSQAFYLSQKYRVPVIVLGDKHLAESKYTMIDSPIIIESKKSITKLERFNSYEKDKEGSATEDQIIVKANIEKRLAKEKQIEKESAKFSMYKIYGKTNSKNLVIGWGSTKGAIRDAIEYSNLDCKFLQILYLEPFSTKIAEEIKKSSNVIVIENNATSPLSDLIKQKTGIEINNKILRYDGRPFICDELKQEIQKKLK